MDTIEKINLAEKFARITEIRTPKIVGELNMQEVKLVKMKGEFIWHHHDHEDELFLVIKGGFTMQLRTGDIEIREGEFIIIPRGVEHRPVAPEEAHILLFEPKGTLNTGNVVNEYTKDSTARL